VLSVETLGGDHLDAAALLVAHTASRSRHPLTDDAYQGEVRTALGRVDLADGVVAFRDGEVAGFLAGFRVPLFGGLPAIYVPEWCHATDGGTAVYGPMYRRAATRWVADGRTTHAVTTFAGDRPAQDAWSRLGFGQHGIDAARRVGTPSLRSIAVAPAGEADLEGVLALHDAMSTHLRGAPSFIDNPRPDRDELVGRLADTLRPVLLARAQAKPVGMVSITTSEDAPLSIRRRVPVRIDGMYVDPDSRGSGVGATLVAAALAWASEHGFDWLAVDYETANLEAAAFWPTQGFDPLLVSVVRNVATRTTKV